MTVPEARPVERLRPWIRAARRSRLVDVERQRGHPLADLALPELARTVPVDLDPVLVGVAEVQRLADEMIREPGEGHAGRGRHGRASAPGRRDRAPAGRSGRARCGRPAGLRSALLDQALAASRPPAPSDAETPSRSSTSRPMARTVELDRALEIRHREMNRTDRGRGRELGAGRRARRFELLGIGRENQISPDDTLIKPQVSLSCIVVAAWWQPLSKVR